ncbi:AAA family ATPase [Xanthomonas arboricola]|uniref:AAA family ATPase n=1 Tax=Xanthomonas arboricola TaxID=56448 RepID=UPI00161A38C4|nr:DUF3696 domain-containing protein [Xanthomonas arboricola]MBB5859018.1 putative ATPase [Xanthomonas arboricola]
MNKAMRIKGFKCFEDVSIPLSKLTILCGPNSGGKSSILQALLLYDLGTSTKSDGVAVNGPYGLQLGDAEQIMNRSAFGREGDDFSISIDPGYLVKFGLHSDRRFLKVNVTEQGGMNESQITHYVGAERKGPRISQAEFANLGAENIDVGYAGQYVAEILLNLERKQIREELRPSGEENLLLLAPIVEYYLSEIFGPIQIQSRPNGNAPPSLYFRRRELEEEWTLSSNTGFGITYVLPIIVAGLLCPKDSMLIIDSPEAHLHPQAQTAVAKFLCMVAAGGVNVVVETHSDYVIEGVRISIKEKDRAVSFNECLILSIGLTQEGVRSISPLSVLENGSLSQWPKGFFDQHVINMRSMIDTPLKQ